MKKKPEVISVSDIAEIFQGKIRMGRCIFHQTICRNYRDCFLRKELMEIERLMVSKLKKVTVASILKKQL